MASKVGKLARFLDGIPIVANSTERDSLFPSPDTHQRVENRGSGYVERYDGSQWVQTIALGRGGNSANAKAFGARGDGTTDDTSALQDAIDEVYDLGGGVVELPYGVYLVTSLTAKAGVTLRGVPDKRQFYYMTQILQASGQTVPVLDSTYPDSIDLNDPSDRLFSFNLEDISFKTQNGASTAPAVRIRYAGANRWRNVHITAGSTSQTPLELADVWDSQFDFVILTEGAYSLDIVNRGDIDNSNNLVFMHPHFESPRKGWVRCLGETGSTHQNTKISFFHPKWEGHITSSGTAGCELQYCNNIKVFGGFSGTPLNGAGTPPSTFPMLHVTNDVHDVLFDGHTMENGAQQIGSYVKFTGTNIWGIKLLLGVENITHAPTDGLVTFASGAAVQQTEVDVYSLYDDSGMTAADYVGSISGATIDTPTVHLKVKGIWYTRPVFSEDGVLNSVPGIAFKRIDGSNYFHLGWGDQSGGRQSFKILDDATEILAVGTDQKIYVDKKMVLGGFGVGADIASIRQGSKTFDWASLAAGARQTTTVPVTGAALGDTVLTPSMSVSLGGTELRGEVTAADTVTVTQFNPTGGAVDVASGTLKVHVVKNS